MNLIQQIDQSHLDRSMLLFLNSWTGHSSLIDLLFKTIGEYIIYLVPFFLIGVWVWLTYGGGMSAKERTDRKIVLLQAVIAGIFGWFVLNPIIGHFFPVPRPFSGMGGVKEVLLHRPDKSFPSDHASFLFSIGFYFIYAGWKRIGGSVLILGIVVSFARVVLGVHYPFDILGGMVIGIVGAWVIYVLRPWIESYFSRPLIKLMSYIKL